MLERCQPPRARRDRLTAGDPRAPARILLGILLATCALGCQDEDVAFLERPHDEVRAERLDLPGIRARGSLRLLLVRGEETLLARTGWPPEREREHVAVFARELGLSVERVYVDGYADLLPALLDGRGDLVADNLTVTPRRAQRVAFSAPYAVVREQVVMRADEDPLSSPADLEGRRVAVRRSSSFWETLAALRASYPGIEVEEIPEALSVKTILEGVAAGSYDLTLSDSNLVEQVLAYRDDVRVGLELDRDVVIAWAMRPEAIELRRAVDAFLTRVGAASQGRSRYRDDLPGLKKRGVLRVLTRNNASTYYVWRGRLVGFEYELARAFADRVGLRLEMIVPPSRDDLVRWLHEGRGDVIAAGLTASQERAEAEELAFSGRYHRVQQMIVARLGDRIPENEEELAGRTLVVRRRSHYWRTLEALRETGIDFELRAAPEELETEEIIARVAAGTYDLTLADSHIVDIELTWRDDVVAAFALGAPVDHGWAVRPGNPELLAEVDAFFADIYRSTFYNVVAQRYFREPKRIRTHAERRAARQGRISEWDEPLREFAAEYGFDWRLIAAQMHQESGFDPKARSFAGARGLLQVLPETARQMGVDQLEEPADGILAGVRYLAWVRERFDSSLPSDERQWFALAAYNAGWGHVNDARRLAVERGLDPNRWFGHVEEAMLLLAKPEIASRMPFGYCRCSETVRYVREIRERYLAYVQVVSAWGERVILAALPTSPPDPGGSHGP